MNELSPKEERLTRFANLVKVHLGWGGPIHSSPQGMLWNTASGTYIQKETHDERILRSELVRALDLFAEGEEQLGASRSYETLEQIRKNYSPPTKETWDSGKFSFPFTPNLQNAYNLGWAAFMMGWGANQNPHVGMPESFGAVTLYYFWHKGWHDCSQSGIMAERAEEG